MSTRVAIKGLEASETQDRSGHTARSRGLRISGRNRYLVLRWTKWEHKHRRKWQLLSIKATCMVRIKALEVGGGESPGRASALNSSILLSTTVPAGCPQSPINPNRKWASSSTFSLKTECQSWSTRSQAGDLKWVGPSPALSSLKEWVTLSSRTEGLWGKTTSFRPLHWCLGQESTKV